MRKPTSRRLVHFFLSFFFLFNTFMPNVAQAAALRPPQQAPDPARNQAPGDGTILDRLKSLNAAVLQAVPESGTVTLGSTFDVHIELAGLVSPLSGFQFDLSYDPALLQQALKLGANGYMEKTEPTADLYAAAQKFIHTA